MNVMDTFVFSNLGTGRRYVEPEPSDASVNTQFEAMELEEDQVRNNIKYEQLLAQDEINNTNFNCIVLAAVKHLNEDSEDKVIYNKLKVLLDSGASSSIVYKNRLPQAIAATLKRKQTPTVWTTNTGTFTTNKQVTLTFKLVEFQLNVSFDGR